MSYYVVQGGQTLRGSVPISGAKNSVLPILAATLLNGGRNVLHNCPDLRDVRSAIQILEHLGCKVSREGDTVTVDSTVVDRWDVPHELMREMRSSVIFLGPILARCGRARLSLPGGCDIGQRPIDLHLSALRKLGAVIREQGGDILCEASDLQGRDIILSFPSVGATENTLLTATACGGVTRIINAAREPEITDLQEFLRKAGALVLGGGESAITVSGSTPRRDVEHTILPDRIEAATFLCAAAACGGEVTLTGAEPEHVGTVIQCLRDAGCTVRSAGRTITLLAPKRLGSMPTVRTMPYPGFPTDSQAPLMAAACTAQGSALFIETIFENRFRHAAELQRMGADIRISGRTALVTGRQLHGARVRSTDLRGGAALVVAALAAQGESRVEALTHIDRGYEHFAEKLIALGASIRRVDD
ncbi:MAG: UDP-N-acetylglucosamine 1-carboxyvinyltransferase [Clostridia bacterium]|nr:UDP-N-acetylglucosamine 1-carboxyvinyltransferase [Clostridia bacterium]